MGLGGSRGKGKGMGQVDGDEEPGVSDWGQQAQHQPDKEANVVDQDGYQAVKKSSVLGNLLPEIFAVDKLNR